MITTSSAERAGHRPDSRTCASPIVLTYDTDFAEPCEFLAQKFLAKANP